MTPVIFPALLASTGGSGTAMAEPCNSPIQGIVNYQVFPRKGMTADIPFATTLGGGLRADVLKQTDGRTVGTKTWDLPQTAGAASASNP